MEIKQIENIVEALLFAAGDEVSAERLARVIDIYVPTLKNIIRNMMSNYNYESRGLKIIELENAYQICTRPEYFDYVRALIEPTRSDDLSKAALEVLAIIAYNQPVTKGIIEKVRGVDCSGPLHKLLNRNLVEEVGRHESPGRPYLFGTTKEFLRCFGLSSVKDLPGEELLAAMAENNQSD